jgi:formylglycine-generating enzyme required for sulfatase activity
VRGGDLPTEAQYEYVASGLSSLPYVWGNDPPAPQDAVFSGSMIPLTPPLPPVRVAGSAVRDRLELEGGTVVDLAGNMSEWTRDIWNVDGQPCWGPGVFTDPVCMAPDTTLPPSWHGFTARGGSWSDDAGGLRAALRRRVVVASEIDAGSADIGFRCVRPA